MMKSSVQRKIFVGFNAIILTLFALVCLLPFINLLAISLSSSQAANSGQVSFFPVGFSTEAYSFLLQKKEFFSAFGMSVGRVVLGTMISLSVVILAAYPLSKGLGGFIGRKFYVVFFTLTMFFSGGLVPVFLVITSLGLYNTIWALVLPTAANAWNIVLLINFFRRLPKDLEEYAQLDGAGYFRRLFQIVLPVSLPAIATVALFTAVQHWNSWFDGIIYMDSERYPLQSYIYDIINQVQSLSNSPNLTPEQQQALSNLPGKTLRSAQIFIAMLPIMCVYPFAQKFFIQGLVMGAVKE